MSNRGYIVSTLKDGDTIVEYEYTEVVSPTNSQVFISLTMPVISTIDKIVELHVTNNTSPAVTAYGITAVRVSGNVVGFTIASVAASTTIAVNCCAIGI
ncbi:MAG: hypothetical protein ACW968_01320 [Candidatus Thorarchaeota archaeon]|jgi:hypothetical protein